LIKKSPNIGLILIQKFDSKSLNSFCFEPKSIAKIQKPIFNLPYSFLCFRPTIPSGPIPFLFIFLCVGPVAIGPHSSAGPSFGLAHHRSSPSCSNRTRQAAAAAPMAFGCIRRPGIKHRATSSFLLPEPVSHRLSSPPLPLQFFITAEAMKIHHRRQPFSPRHTASPPPPAYKRHRGLARPPLSPFSPPSPLLPAPISASMESRHRR
jgi:hypothetical protein